MIFSAFSRALTKPISSESSVLKLHRTKKLEQGALSVEMASTVPVYHLANGEQSLRFLLSVRTFLVWGSMKVAETHCSGERRRKFRGRLCGRAISVVGPVTLNKKLLFSWERERSLSDVVSNVEESLTMCLMIYSIWDAAL